mgnify:CR=1 FL=1
MKLIIPSIDLSNGYAVKRVRGVRGSELVKLSVGEALSIVKGYSYVHVVDLDGAEQGRVVNLDSIALIGRELGGRCQVGGGIRSIGDASRVLKYCDRVVLGTLAVEEPKTIEHFINELGWDKVAVSLDVLNGYVVSRGWRSLVKRVEDALMDLPKVKAIVYTAVDVEGTGGGPRASRELVNMLKARGSEAYYAGGVSDCGQVRYLWGMGFDGVIVGYLIYVRRVDCNG